MSEINNISINISLETLPLKQKSFGVPLIVGITDPTSTDRYFEISDADELLAPSIGYASTSPEYKMAQSIFSQSPRMEKAAVYQLSAWTAIATELATLQETKDDWYWLLITDKTKAVIDTAIPYINSKEKMGVFATSGTTPFTGAEDRAMIVVSDFAIEHPDAAWVGRCGALQIGSVTWDSKQLSGQQNSKLTPSEQSSILAWNGNVIREMGGVNVTWEGKTLSGQYIDIINGRDYIKARITEAWHALKINNEKIPMTKSGLDMIEAMLRGVFRECGRNGIIASVGDSEERAKSDMGDYQYQLTMPESVKDVSANDRANRKVAVIRFRCVVGGGINKLEISGTMGV